MVEQDWSYWQGLLRGEKQDVHEGDPHTGYYRQRNKTSFDAPVALWVDEHGEYVGRVGKDRYLNAQQVNDIWTYVANRPVSHEDYQHALEHGNWPGDTEDVAAVGDNSKNASPFELKAEEAKTLVKAADAIKEIKTKAEADKAANYRDQLNATHKALDEMRKVEKKPHDDAGKAVQAKFLPHLNPTKAAADKLKKLVGGFLAEQKRKADAAKRRVQEELDREAAAAGEEAVQVDVISQASKVGGQRGKSTSLRTVYIGEITDQAAFLNANMNHPFIQDAMQRVASELARTQTPCAGLVIKDDQRAA